MKFAFLILGDFRPEADRAAIHGGAAQMRGVSTLEDACAAARELLEQGVGCIELCGAFGPDGARRIIEATENRIPVGYVTHLLSPMPDRSGAPNDRARVRPCWAAPQPVKKVFSTGWGDILKL